jgi:molybdate transport system substrate-binding protein
MATRQLLAELAGAVARDMSQPLITAAAGGVEVARRIEAGEAVDIVVLADKVIDKLIAVGRLRAASRVDLVRSDIAVAVRSGAPRPDISDAQAVKRCVLEARSLSYSTGPSGIYLEQLFERWGILQQLRSRIVVPPPGVPVGTLVADGRCELGFQQLSELISLRGIEVLGTLPAEIQATTVFSGGIASHCTNPLAARQVLEYLAAPATKKIKQRYGMDGMQ